MRPVCVNLRSVLPCCPAIQRPQLITMCCSSPRLGPRGAWACRAPPQPRTSRLRACAQHWWRQQWWQQWRQWRRQGRGRRRRRQWAQPAGMLAALHRPDPWHVPVRFPTRGGCCACDFSCTCRPRCRGAWGGGPVTCSCVRVHVCVHMLSRWHGSLGCCPAHGCLLWHPTHRHPEATCGITCCRPPFPPSR